MVRKSLWFALLTFALYSLFLALLAPAWWYASQHHWHQNRIKAQNFLFSEQTPDRVIVGSSLSCHIRTDTTNAAVNLSFSGQSAFDGLNLIFRKEKMPKTVFIEMNYFLRPENERFTDSFSPVAIFIKKRLLALREERQPLAVLGSQIIKWVDAPKGSSVSPEKAIPASKPKANEPKKSQNSAFLKTRIQMVRKDLSQLPDPKLLKLSIENLKNCITKLESRNIEVVFFEMPINSQLMSSPLPTAIRKAFFENFPPSRYSYIPIEDSVEYTTSDGLHLKRGEDARYSAYFFRKVRELEL